MSDIFTQNIDELIARHHVETQKNPFMCSDRLLMDIHACALTNNITVLSDAHIQIVQDILSHEITALNAYINDPTGYQAEYDLALSFNQKALLSVGFVALRYAYICDDTKKMTIDSKGQEHLKFCYDAVRAAYDPLADDATQSVQTLKIRKRTAGQKFLDTLDHHANGRLDRKAIQPVKGVKLK